MTRVSTVAKLSPNTSTTAIVLVDQMDLEIKSGKPRYDAVIDAATSRVRPVMMGALTTVLGVMPLFLDAFFQHRGVLFPGR